jgi:hypothetical protein
MTYPFEHRHTQRASEPVRSRTPSNEITVDLAARLKDLQRDIRRLWRQINYLLILCVSEFAIILYLIVGMR